MGEQGLTAATPKCAPVTSALERIPEREVSANRPFIPGILDKYLDAFRHGNHDLKTSNRVINQNYRTHVSGDEYSDERKKVYHSVQFDLVQYETPVFLCGCIPHVHL